MLSNAEPRHRHEVLKIKIGDCTLVSVEEKDESCAPPPQPPSQLSPSLNSIVFMHNC